MTLFWCWVEEFLQSSACIYKIRRSWTLVSRVGISTVYVPCLVSVYSAARDTLCFVGTLPGEVAIWFPHSLHLGILMRLGFGQWDIKMKHCVVLLQHIILSEKGTSFSYSNHLQGVGMSELESSLPFCIIKMGGGQTLGLQGSVTTRCPRPWIICISQSSSGLPFMIWF